MTLCPLNGLIVETSAPEKNEPEEIHKGKCSEENKKHSKPINDWDLQMEFLMQSVRLLHRYSPFIVPCEGHGANPEEEDKD